jgi:hypothetical protein
MLAKALMGTLLAFVEIIFLVLSAWKIAVAPVELLFVLLGGAVLARWFRVLGLPALPVTIRGVGLQHDLLDCIFHPMSILPLIFPFVRERVDALMCPRSTSLPRSIAS